METFRGYLRYPVDLHYTINGKAVSRFALYDTSQYDRSWTVKVYVIAWDELGELAYYSLLVDDLVHVQGYYKTNTWVDHTGQERSQQELVAKDINLILHDGTYKTLKQIQEELNANI